jgi:hypothetical protein
MDDSKSPVVPFFANTPDGTHCFQASIRGALKYFLPDRNFSWEQLEKMSGKEPGKATWPQQMLVNLKEMDFDAIMVEGFDGRDFIKRGSQYLIDTFGEKTANWQIKNSDVPQEQKRYQRLFDVGVRCENRIPQLDEIKEYLQRGYLVICTVNSRALNHKDGYVGHSVLVYAVDDTYVTLHDPGPKPQESRQVPLTAFEVAWANPSEKAKNFIALKYTGEIHG